PASLDSASSRACSRSERNSSRRLSASWMNSSRSEPEPPTSPLPSSSEQAVPRTRNAPAASVTISLSMGCTSRSQRRGAAISPAYTRRSACTGTLGGSDGFDVAGVVQAGDQRALPAVARQRELDRRERRRVQVEAAHVLQGHLQ